MITKKKLRDEVIRLNYRIADLEERLCPCNQHDYVETSHEYVIGHSPMEVNTLRTFKCKRCGKVIQQYDDWG